MLHHGGVMVTGREFWRPSYVRRAPRWHDGVGRLMDLGGTFDLHLPYESNEQASAEDWLMVRDDLRRAVSALRDEVAAINSGV